jgi:hypothetical protein
MLNHAMRLQNTTMTKSKPTATKSLPVQAAKAAKPATKAVPKLCIVCHTSLPKQRRQSKSKFVDESKPDNKEYHRACKTMAMTIYRCQALNMLKMSSQQRK